jgi:hypothetical protein
MILGTAGSLETQANSQVKEATWISRKLKEKKELANSFVPRLIP